MTNLSQKNLINLANESIKNKDLTQAEEYLEEALNLSYDENISKSLVKVYLSDNKEDQAYDLVKEEPDLFSDSEIFSLYLETLARNNYFIEFLQLKKLLDNPKIKEVVPEKLEKQMKIMQAFKKKSVIRQKDYQSLFKLNLTNFVNFSKSILIDPSQSFALRLAICEDLVKLKMDENIPIIVLDQMTAFNPSLTPLLAKNTVYQEIISSIGDRLSKNPSILPTVLSETNLLLGTIYPKIDDFVDEPDSFSKDLVNFVLERNGGEHQEILTKIYQNISR